MNENQDTKPYETKEVSVLMRNLRFLKRVILGKNPPPVLLRILCYVFLGWSLLMVIGFLFIGLGYSAGNFFNNAKNNLGVIPPKYFYTYALLHAIALLGLVLMYRKKLTGFYIFSVVTLLMPFWEFIITHYFKFQFGVFLFSLASIGLFAINWNIFDANVRKKEKLRQEQNNAAS